VAALQAGKHVMCEKPMAINTAEAMKMVQAAKKAGKLLTIGYQNRYRADSRYLKQECQAGTLGDIYYARAKAIRRRGVPTWGVFLNEYEQGGGPLIDIGTHALDLTLWMMDNYAPKLVSGTVYHRLNKSTDQGNVFGPWKPEAFTVEDSAFGFIQMENGATINLEASWALNTLDTEEGATMLCGTKAGADMRDGLRINGVRFERQYVTKPDLNAGGVAFFEGVSQKPEEMEQYTFLKAIRGEGQLVVLPEQALAVTKILEAIYESARKGAQVSL
jgi:predicted dehydrogenase